MNTGILSAVTLYLKLSGGNQVIATDVSIGTAIVLFYHVSTHPSIVKLRMKLSGREGIFLRAESHTSWRS